MSPWIWLGVAVLMAIIEALSLGLITVWFVIGAIVAFVANWCGASLLVQIILFAVISLVLLLVLRPFAMKYRKKGESTEATPVGMNAVVIERIDNNAMTGRVETPDRMSWAALSATGEPIEEGVNVRVVDHKSIKLVVEQI